MNEIRVLHCIESLSWGGLELYTSELIENLAKTRIEQFVFCSTQSQIYQKLKDSGKVTLLAYSEKKLSKLTASSVIRKLTKKYNITHLHSHTRIDMWNCALSRAFSKKPFHIYNLYMNALPKQDFVHRWLFSKVDAICSSSTFVLSEAKKNFPIDPEKLILMRYGRNAEAYVSNTESRNLLRSQLGIPKEALVFGTLCRIDPGKGLKEIVEAISKLSKSELENSHFVIVGDPTIIVKNADGVIYETASEQLLNWIKDTQSKLDFPEHLHLVPFQKDYVPYINILDIFFLASHNETYSLSVLDAMFMGKAVIGTDAGGTTEQIGQNERGYLVEPKSSESMLKALQFYLQNPQEALQQGQAAKTWVHSEHSWNQTIDQTLDLYKKGLSHG